MTNGPQPNIAVQTLASDSFSPPSLKTPSLLLGDNLVKLALKEALYQMVFVKTLGVDVNERVEVYNHWKDKLDALFSDGENITQRRN